MSVETTQRTWLALVLVSGLALGEVAPPAADHPAPAPAPVSLPDPAPPPPSDRVTDLDFSDDFPAPNRTATVRTPGKSGSEVTRKAPASAALPPPEPSRAWAYWTAGVAALAAGGAAWYLHWGDRPPPDPVRSDQVFTDEAD